MYRYRKSIRTLESNASPHVFLVDARRVESIDPSAFTAFLSYVEERFEQLRRSVKRLVMVRPGGLPGAAISGFFEVMHRRPYRVLVVESPNDAFRWLGEVEPMFRNYDWEWVAELDRVFGGALSETPTASALRDLLDRDRTHSVEDAAMALAFTPRTLQRRLNDEGTSFRQELQAARIRSAQKLLVESDLPIKCIALDAGCSSVQHFGSLFRRLTGQTPVAWRRLQRVAWAAR